MSNTMLNKAETLYEQLRTEIGKRKNGERFYSVRGIMKRYTVSQSVVDRTLLLLRNEGLLTTTPGSGMFVCASGLEEGMQEAETVRQEVLLLVPRWPSTDIDTLTARAEAINTGDSKWHIRIEAFDYVNTIPRNFDGALRRAAGMIIRSASGNFQQADLNALSHYCSIKPTIVLGHPLEGLKTGCAGLDSYFASGLAMHHLMKHGHRRIGLLVSEPHTRGIRERVRGVHGFAKLLGMQVDVIDCCVVSGEVAMTKTYKRFLDVLQEGFRFTALLGVSGESIQGAVNACHNYKLRIPEDLSVVAISGENLTAISSPPLDTVAGNVGGQLDAALLMIDRIAASRENHAPEEVFLQTELIKRGSVLDITNVTTSSGEK